MSVWYRTGTISVANGSTTVTGVGTQWVDARIQVGDEIRSGSLAGEVASVVSNTQITLAVAYEGSTISGASYAIVPTRGVIREWVNSANAFIDQIATYQAGPLAGRFGNGTAALPGLAFLSQINTGLFRPATSVLAISVNGTERGRWTTNGLEVTGTIRGTGAENLPALISAASDTGVVSTAHLRSVLASVGSRASGVDAAVIASSECTAAANRSIIGSARASTTNGDCSFIFGSWSGGCETSGTACGVLSGNRVRNDTLYSVAMGFAASGAILTSNQKIRLEANNGNILLSGSLTSSHTFSDFAEMFPNAEGVEIPLGTIVTEENGAVRPAGPGDEIAGVVTATAVVTAGDTPFAWQGRYLSDEWGQPIMVEILDPDWEAEIPDPSWQADPDGPEDQQPALMANPQPQQMINVQKENPAWNPAAPQVPRSERPDEWTRVGLLGQVFTRVSADVVPGDKLSAVDGIGVKSTARTGLRCMTITQPYDAAKGYAVARCLINIQV